MSTSARTTGARFYKRESQQEESAAYFSTKKEIAKMGICNKCGTQMQDGIRFCPACGADMGAAAAALAEQPAQQPYQQQYQPQPPQSQQYQQQPAQQSPPMQQQYQQPPMQQQYQQPYQQPYQQQPQLSPQADADANKGMAILAYIIFFIPLLTGAHKSSPFVRHHANQGTVLFLFALVWGIVYSILIGIFTAMLFTPSAILSGTWGAFGIISTILGLLWFIPLILWILGIVNAATGKLKALPVIGKFTIIK
jgi:uncharacterized membrane protein